MSNPSFDNIDKWLFEYTEGNLSSQQETQLKQFLLQNPNLEKDLDAWQNATVKSVPVVFPNIDSHIRKPIAWWIPAAAVSFVFGTISLAWVNENTNVSQLVALDSAHMVSAIQVENSAEKGEAYFESKNNNKTPNFMLVGNGSTSVVFGHNWNNKIPVYSGLVGNVNAFEVNDFHSNYPLEIESVNQSLNIKKDKIEGAEFKLKNDNSLSSSASNSASDIEELTKNTKSEPRAENKYGSSYNNSFLSKLKSIALKIVRMTDNPLALSNSKDIYYHTPGMQAMDVNFGSAGSLSTPRLQSVSRAQWSGRANQQISSQISFDTYVKSIRGGIGFQVNHVYYGGGAYQIGQFALTYSPKFLVSKNIVIEPAIRFKMGNTRLQNQKMIPGQLVELDRQNQRTYMGEGVNAQTQDLWYKDVGFALMTNTKWFSAGIQIDNLGRHQNNIYNSTTEKDRQGYHLNATLGADYVSRSKLFSFSPYLMCQKVENLSEIWGGSIFRYKKLTTGGGYSSLGDYAGSIGFKTNRLMLTYAIDFTQSLVLNERLLSQQLTLRLLTNRNRIDYRMLNL